MLPSWITVKLIVIASFISLFLICMVLVKQNISLHVQYNGAEANLQAIANQQKVNDKLIAEVQAKQDENDQAQKRALIEMHNKGYLPDGNGDNPDWMCASPDGCHKDPTASESN